MIKRIISGGMLALFWLMFLGLLLPTMLSAKSSSMVLLGLILLVVLGAVGAFLTFHYAKKLLSELDEEYDT